MKSKVVSLMLLAGLCSCNKQSGIPGASQEYAVQSVTTTTADLEVSYPATIKGKQDIEIRPKVSGFITKLCVDEGSVVRKGQPLFLIDRVEFEAAVKSAEANVKVAEANVSTQRLTVENKAELHKKEIISDYDLKMAQNQLAAYQASLAQAQANLVSARNNLSYTTVVSPSDGIVGSIPYRVGSLVSASSQAPLTTVSEISTMYVYFSMTEKQLLDLTREGENLQVAINKMPELKLILADGTEYAQKGKVETISGVIDQNTGSVNMRAAFPNQLSVLRSGGTGSVRIPTHVENAILIPQKATYEIQDKKFVYILQKDNTVKSTSITVESQNDGVNYVVTSGLKSGDRIVVDGIRTLKNGQQITPITPQQATQNRKKAEKDIEEGKLPGQ